jgi:hypothetical protein
MHRTKGGSNQAPDAQCVLQTAAGLHLQFTGSKRANGAGLGDDSIDVVAVQPLKQRRVEKGSYLKTKP